MADDRTDRQIIDDALAGTPGDLHFEFRSINKNERMDEMNKIIKGYGLDGLTVKVLLNHIDAPQPAPFEIDGHFRSWGYDETVPAGWYFLRLAKAQT